MTSIWVPPSHFDREAVKVRKAVKQYDSNLDFGLNEKTQQWCVFLKQGTMEGSKEHSLPILGFNQMPSPDEAIKRLYHTDAFRRGMEIMDDLQKNNDGLHDESKHKDVDGDVAEHIDWAMRKVKHPNAPVRVYPGR